MEIRGRKDGKMRKGVERESKRDRRKGERKTTWNLV